MGVFAARMLLLFPRRGSPHLKADDVRIALFHCVNLARRIVNKKRFVRRPLNIFGFGRIGDKYFPKVLGNSVGYDLCPLEFRIAGSQKRQLLRLEMLQKYKSIGKEQFNLENFPPFKERLGAEIRLYGAATFEKRLMRKSANAEFGGDAHFELQPLDRINKRIIKVHEDIHGSSIWRINRKWYIITIIKIYRQYRFLNQLCQNFTPQTVAAIFTSPESRNRSE